MFRCDSWVWEDLYSEVATLKDMTSLQILELNMPWKTTEQLTNYFSGETFFLT
jgi:hypothetical protein